MYGDAIAFTRSHGLVTLCINPVKTHIIINPGDFVRTLDARRCTTIKQLNKLIDDTSLSNPVFFFRYLPDRIIITEKMKDTIRHYYNMQTDPWDAPLEFRTIPCEVKDGN